MSLKWVLKRVANDLVNPASLYLKNKSFSACHDIFPAYFADKIAHIQVSFRTTTFAAAQEFQAKGYQFCPSWDHFKLLLLLM